MTRPTCPSCGAYLVLAACPWSRNAAPDCGKPYRRQKGIERVDVRPR